MQLANQTSGHIDHRDRDLAADRQAEAHPHLRIERVGIGRHAAEPGRRCVAVHGRNRHPPGIIDQAQRWIVGLVVDGIFHVRFEGAAPPVALGHLRQGCVVVETVHLSTEAVVEDPVAAG